MTALVSYAAIGLLFVGAAAAGSGDYVLIVPGEPPICAKSRDTCEAAREAIRKGWWLISRRDAATVCRPMPGCFPESSNHIRGFN